MKEKKIEEKYNIIDKGLTPEKKKGASYYLEGTKDGAMKPIEGEYIKTPEELKIIKHINKYLNEEFKELDIEEKIKILPEQIHFLPTDIYKRFCSQFDEKVSALFYPLGQSIFIDKHYFHKKRLNLYKAIFHEAIHMASFLKFGVKEEKPFTYRSGYDTFIEGDKKHKHFCGLNEMIVDQEVSEILNKHKNELVKELNITPEETNKTVGEFYTRDILYTIIETIAGKNKEEKKDVWTRFKKGLFTGEMMHLREVERAFGKGALRMLSALGPGTKKDLEDSENYRKILNYFKTDDEKEREKIADEILIEREKEEYNKQRRKR